MDKSVTYRTLLFSACSLVFFGSFSCRKKDSGSKPTLSSDMSINIQHNIGISPLLLDTVKYTNKAGNQYSVTKLEYFLSRIVLHGDKRDFVCDNADYINSSITRFSSTRPVSVPLGHYKGLTLYIGLDSLHNISGILPHTVEHENMAWPASMGGGYHFLKLEGRFRDTGGLAGYALHLGRNNNLVKVDMDADFTLSSGQHEMVLAMDISEWFENPHTYNLLTDGRYIMSSAASMKKISENGRDVLKFTELK